MDNIKSLTITIAPEIVSQTFPELTEAQVAAVMEELMGYENDIFDFIFEKIEDIIDGSDDEDDEDDEEDYEEDEDEEDEDEEDEDEEDEDEEDEDEDAPWRVNKDYDT
jgi:hypothetical protein